MKHEPIYMSAADLGISDVERNGLIQLKGELERGEIRHAIVDGKEDPVNAGFNMNFEGYKQWPCGTVACIGGHLLLRGQLRGTVSRPTSTRLYQLFWLDSVVGREWFDITPAQAARAIRNFLTTGEPRWREAIA